MIPILVEYPVEEANPWVCYHCFRCSSGCPVALVLRDYRPHRIVAKFRYGRGRDLIDSEIIWKCTQCYKCVNYCPQGVSPALVVELLKYLASREGYPIPAAYLDMIRNIKETGYAFREMEVTDREFEIHDRESLGLDPLKPPADMDVLRRILEGLT